MPLGYWHCAHPCDFDICKACVLKAKVDKDVKEAGRLGVSGTPGFFINGRHMSGAKPFSEFKVVIDEEIKKEG